MNQTTKEILEKYGIDPSDLKLIGLDDISDNLVKSAEQIAKIWGQVIANIYFSEFVSDFENRNYEKTYNSVVFKSIDNLCSDKNIVEIKKGTKVYRARIINDINDIYDCKKGIHFEGEFLKGYDWINSKEPPLGIASDGRANRQYSSYFYCSDNGPTAASEIKANIGDYISLALFTINRDLKMIQFEEKEILEISSLPEWYQYYIAKCFTTPVSDPKQYHITQFISDEIRKHGVDGICYKSHFTNNNNYVIFNCSMDTIVFFSSKILQLHSQQLNFIDFSAEKIISTKPIPDLSADAIQTKKAHIYGIIQAQKNEIPSNDNSKMTEDDKNGQTENAQS